MLQIERRKVPMYLAVLLLNLVCLGGNGIWGLKRIECIYILGILLVIMSGPIYRKLSELKYVLPTLFLVFTIWTSASPKSTKQYMFIYLAGLALIYSGICEDEFNSIVCRIVKIVGTCNAVAIILSPIIPGIMSNVIGLVYYPISPIGAIERTYADITRGVYYGFCGEKSVTAFVMSSALIVYIVEYFANFEIKKSGIVSVIILFTANMMTGKRMEFLVPIIYFLLLFIVIRRHNKAIKFARILLIGALALYLLPIIVPGAALVLDRFLDSGADSFNTGRDVLWNYAIDMYNGHKLMGTGYGSYNSIVNALGFISPTGEDYWNYHAHSIYYQILGECGILGCLIWGYLYLGCLIKGLIALRRNYLSPNLLLGTGLLFMTLMYGLSGNTLYYYEQLYMSFFALACYRSWEISREKDIER